MNEIRILTGLELRSLYGFNRFLHTKDPKAKKRYLVLMGAWAVILGMILFYVGLLVYGLCTLGLASIVPMYLCVIVTALILMFGIFRAGAHLFDDKGYDLLASMPLGTRAIVISRLLGMYLEDLALSLAVFVPGTVVFGICMRPSVWYYLISLVCVFFLPVVPLVAATLIGSLIMAISARTKHKNMIQTVLLLAFSIGMVCLSFSMQDAPEEIDPDALASLAAMLGEKIAAFYPPAAWFGAAVLGTDLLSLLWFLLLAVGLTVGTAVLLCCTFTGIMRRLHRFSAKHTYKIGQMESRGLLGTLYLREAKRYFSSSIYVTNTILGPVFGTILAGVVCFGGLDSLQQNVPFDITDLLPFGLAAIFCMMPATCSAVSMEGKQFWAIKSLPIPTKTWLDSKILLNLSLMLPCYLVSEVFLFLAIKPDPLAAVWMVLIPALIMLFSAVLGITVNLKFRNFEWERAEQVVKQGSAAFFGGFAGPLLSLVLGVISLLMPPVIKPFAHSAMCLLLAVSTWLLYVANNKVRMEEL